MVLAVFLVVADVEVLVVAVVVVVRAADEVVAHQVETIEEIPLQSEIQM